MPNGYDNAWLQGLARVDGLAFTRVALEPGMRECNVDSQHSTAIAYWQAQLAQGTLAAPVAPVPTTNASGGTILAGTYQVKVTYVNAFGESFASASGPIVTTGSVSTITVPSPAASGNATGWYAYVTQVGGNTYTLQQAAGSPTNIGTGLTLTAPPTSSGVGPPTFNSTGLLPAVYLAVVTDAVGHLQARQSYFRNPAGTSQPPERS